MAIQLKKELQAEAFLGLYQRPATSGLNPRYLRECFNVDLRGGTLGRRGALRRVNNTVLSGTQYGLFYARFASGTTERLAAHGGSISKVLREPSAISASLPSDWSARTGGITCWGMLDNQVYIATPVDNPIKYNGTALQKWGIEAPAAVGTITESAGAVSSQRRYIAVYYNSTTQQEGSESPQSSVTSLDNEQASVASPATPTDPQVDQWRLYGAIVEGGRPGVFYRVGTANLTVAIADNLSDTNLKIRQPLEEFSNNAPPSAFKFFVIHGGRIFAVPQGDQSIIDVSDHDGFFSKPESFPVLNYIPINYRDGDNITAMASLDNYLLIFKQFSIWAMIGSWPDITIKAVSYRPDHTSLGTIEQRAIVVFDRAVIFPSHDGVYAIAKGEGAQEDLFQTRRLSVNIDDFYDQIDQSAAMHAAYDRSRRQYRLFCSFRTGQNVNAPVVT